LPYTIRYAQLKKPAARQAHLVFANAKCQRLKKIKELFFASARTENETETVNLETE